MGQYYKPNIQNENKEIIGWLYSHDYGSGLKLMEHSWMKNPFVQTFETLLIEGGQFHKGNVTWSGDYADDVNGGRDTYGECSEDNKLNIPVGKVSPSKYKYVVNHTLKRFVDKSKVPNIDGWKIHPLPLLTSEGNGQGGGDYRGEDPNGLIGSWAGHSISIESKKPVGYEETIFDLKED
jgi:hypothetical protein